MPVYVVERYVSALTPDEVRAYAQRETAVLESCPGGVRHLRTTYLCDDELCFSVFEAPSIEVMREVNDRTGLAYERISEAVDVTMPGEGA